MGGGDSMVPMLFPHGEARWPKQPIGGSTSLYPSRTSCVEELGHGAHIDIKGGLDSIALSRPLLFVYRLAQAWLAVFHLVQCLGSSTVVALPRPCDSLIDA